MYKFSLSNLISFIFDEGLFLFDFLHSLDFHAGYLIAYIQQTCRFLPLASCCYIRNLISKQDINQLAVKPFLITQRCIKKVPQTQPKDSERISQRKTRSKTPWKLIAWECGKVCVVATAESCVIKNLHTRTPTYQHTYTREQETLTASRETQRKINLPESKVFLAQGKSNKINYNCLAICKLTLKLFPMPKRASGTCPRREVSVSRRNHSRYDPLAQLMGWLNCYVLQDNYQRPFLLGTREDNARRGRKGGWWNF